jgi:formylglycine-generating enzyme required for sulfatase activity
MAAKPPDAFLSYTRFDDRHDGGAISAFCRRLASAVQAVTGAPFEIFQDVEGIGIGEHWPGKLDRILDEARFFIPILTPSYFTSGPCRDELAKFLRAEAERGRNDLVLPIYYIECDVLEEKNLRSADPLAGTIHERQRQDWRELRFEPFDVGNVRRALERLAREIVRARRRPTPALPQPQPAANSPRQTTGPAEPPPQTPSGTLGSVPPPGTVFRDIDAPWCPELVVIPPGEFLMGSTEAERQWATSEGAEPKWLKSEQPQHRVRIAYPLAVGRYPVTFEEYDRFCAQTRRQPPDDSGWGRGRRPVINVSWNDAKAYVEWLAGTARKPYRLLTEAEWEYACRAGTTTRYWWGDDISKDEANYGADRTGEVGSHSASPFGLYDMHGNVWEWVEDRWHDTYGGAPEDGTAWLEGNNSGRVVRGGSWIIDPRYHRAACRSWLETDLLVNNLGFRIARTLLIS